MARLKKFFAASTIMFTVLSLSVVAAPKAGAATAGDLIKMNGLSSIYYLGADGKRYVFPNETTYFSWYSDFSRVVTISQSELEALPLGANVTIRPGTKLVKITTNPKVYAVTAGGSLVAIPDEATAIALYGANWAKRVVDVPDAFFTNYKTSSNNVSSSAYPEGSLVKFGTGADVYYINADGKAQKITTEAAFNANRFNWNDVITSTLAMPTTGDDITGVISNLTDTASGAGGVAGAGTGLSVKLNSGTAESANVPSYATLIPFLSFDVTAANDGAVTLSDVVLTRFGTGEASDFDGGYLYDGNTRLTTKRSVNTSDNKITFSNLNYKINAGATKTLVLKMNASASAQVSGSHAFRIAAATDISATGATVSGSFPVAGNMMSFATVDAATVTLTNTGSAADRKIGETQVTVGEFTVNNNNKEDVNIYRVRLKQDEDGSNGAATNYSLDLDGTVVASGVSMADKYVDFVLDTPFTLKKSKNITATVRADIQTDVNKKIQLYLNDDVDFDARGTAYGNFYSANISNTNLDATSAATYTIKGSAINVSMDASKAEASDIKKNTTKVVFADFKIKADSDDVNIEKLPFTIDMSPASSTMKLDNVVMIDSTNNVSYTTATNPTGAASETLNFENVYLKKGVQYEFVVKADVPDETYNVGGSVGYTYKFTFTTTGLTGKYVASDASVASTDFSASSLAGQVMTIAQPKISFSKTVINNATVTKGTNGVLLYEGALKANNVDDLKVSRIKATSTLTGTFASNGNMSASFDRMTLYKVNSDGTETSLNAITSLSGTSVTFSGFTITVPKGTSNAVNFRIRGDVKSDPATGTIAMAVGYNKSSDHIVRDADSNSLVDAQYTSIDSTFNGTLTIGGTGTYTAAFEFGENGTNQDNYVLAGSKTLVGRMKFTAANETAKVVDLAFKNNPASSAATPSDVAAFYAYKESTMTTLLGTATMGDDYFVKFENLNFEVPTTGTTYLYIAAQYKGIDYSANPISDFTATTGRKVQLFATSSATYTTKVTGKSTGDTLSNPTWSAVATSTSKTMTTTGALVSGVTTSFGSATLSNGTSKKVFSFKVTAPSQSTNNVDYDGSSLAVNLATTTFAVATSGSATLQNIKIQRVGGSAGKIAARLSGANSAVLSNALAIDFRESYVNYGSLTDLNVRPGETAEYEVYADISAAASSGANVQLSLSALSNLTYNHYRTSTEVLSTTISPIINGVSDVVGGQLSN